MAAPASRNPACASSCPGALLVAVGYESFQIAVIFYFAPRLGRSEETYGALGIAATMLVWLYVLSRLVTGGAFLNATLWEHAAGLGPVGRKPLEVRVLSPALAAIDASRCALTSSTPPLPFGSTSSKRAPVGDAGS